jgi:hypothetical protein
MRKVTRHRGAYSSKTKRASRAARKEENELARSRRHPECVSIESELPPSFLNIAALSANSTTRARRANSVRVIHSAGCSLSRLFSDARMCHEKVSPRKFIRSGAIRANDITMSRYDEGEERPPLVTTHQVNDGRQRFYGGSARRGNRGRTSGFISTG